MGLYEDVCWLMFTGLFTSYILNQYINAIDPFGTLSKEFLGVDAEIYQAATNSYKYLK